MKQTFTCIDTNHFEIWGTRQTEGDEQLSKFGLDTTRFAGFAFHEYSSRNGLGIALDDDAVVHNRTR